MFSAIKPLRLHWRGACVWVTVTLTVASVAADAAESCAQQPPPSAKSALSVLETPVGRIGLASEDADCNPLSGESLQVDAIISTCRPSSGHGMAGMPEFLNLDRGVAPPVTTLLTRRDHRFEISSTTWRSAKISTLVYVFPDGRTRPVALTIASHQPDGKRWYGSTWRPGTADLAALEHLYAMVFSQVAVGEFSFRQSGAQNDHPRLAERSEPGGQAPALGAIARARNCVAAAIGSGTAKEWQIVRLSVDVDAPPHDSDVGRVVVSDSTGPLAGVPIEFSRAPHAGCRAISGRDGVAECVLFDLHGDAHEDEAGHEPMVATFPGMSNGSSILPPTSMMLPMIRDSRL